MLGGVFTRVAAMANLPIMMGAVLLFHFDQCFLGTGAPGLTKGQPALGAMLLAIGTRGDRVAPGPGRTTVDVTD